MFRTCAFCNGKLDGDGGPSGLGVGKRLAFDEWRARLWVICTSCSRWNLTPLDDRIEKIESVARAAASGRVLASTEQVALIRWERYDLVRVGKPPRVEMATWRYGERLKARDRERAKIVVPLTIAAVGIGIAANAAAGGGLGVVIWNLHGIAEWAYIRIIGNRRVPLVEPPVCAHCGTVMQLRARHASRAFLVPDAHADVAMMIICPRCEHEGTLLTGDDATQALRQGLTYLNARKRGRKRAEHAARVVDTAGGPEGLLRDVARRELTLRSLGTERRLALEMAVDERAEVLELERQWREAEEIAEIADGTLSSSAQIEEELRRLKERGDQPHG